MMTNPGNQITQGQFSFLPPLTDVQITAQIKYALKSGWSLAVEYTDDPHPRNTYWEMFGNPMFDLKDPAGILMEINNCRKTFPNHPEYGRSISEKLAYTYTESGQFQKACVRNRHRLDRRELLHRAFPQPPPIRWRGFDQPA